QVVLDLSEVIEKNEAAQKALNALYEIDNKERKPYLVIIEEADKFVPQVISRKANVIEEISVRGRKRGIGLFITTQRPANVSKNVLAQCSYGFVGRLTIENDLNALRILFNSNDKLSSITKLKTGEFMPFGLEIDGPFKVKKRGAAHMGTTPSVEYNLTDSKTTNIIRELKGESLPGVSVKSVKKNKSAALRVQALPLSITETDATSYAEQTAKRKFILFGDKSESIESVELRYLSLGMCVIRFPTKRNNEYMEYNCIINDNGELVRLEKRIQTLKHSDEYEASRQNYRKWLHTNVMKLDLAEISKDDIVMPINEKRAKTRIGRLFPDANLVDFRTVYLPVYTITLREGNRVRVFNIDGIYGKNIE
ncbi:MAG: ATP-binding protein, partial [Candidatus Micrarchaeota archaeon]|nr:ATP-binding protein [Candidatus Micrarchaeota archaeon]